MLNNTIHVMIAYKITYTRQYNTIHVMTVYKVAYRISSNRSRVSNTSRGSDTIVLIAAGGFY